LDFIFYRFAASLRVPFSSVAQLGAVTGREAKDGDIDFVLMKGLRKFPVQCKQW